MARHRRYIERPDPGPIAPDLPAPSGSWQDPSVDTENVNAAYRQQFERANAAGAEVERLRDREKEWRRISAEQQADYGQLQAEIERLREDYKRELYEQGKQKHARRPHHRRPSPPYRVMLIPELSPRSTYPRFRYLTVQIRLGRWYLILDPEGWWRWRRTLVKAYDGGTADRHDYK